MEEEYVSWSEEERAEIRAFFSGKTGQKLVRMCEQNIADKDSLMVTTNLTSDFTDISRIGIVCSLQAAENRGALNIIEDMKMVGENHADQN